MAPAPPDRRPSRPGRWLDTLTPVGAIGAGVALAGLLFVLPGWARVLAAAGAVGWAARINRPPSRLS